MTSVVLTEYTDPNCTWSWGAEPIVRRLETRYGDQIEIEFVLGGLVRDFEDFHDAANDISESDDVAPHWEEASEQHGMPVDVGVWDEDPPRSTYPASIATKAAFLQDSALGFRYLRRVREATLTERRNIARWETLWEIAESVGIELSSFAGALEDGRAERAFRADMRRMRDRGIRGFPTYELTVDGESTVLGGFLPFERLEERMLRLAPGLEPRELPPVAAFVEAYGSVATREVGEVYGWSLAEARAALEERAAAGGLRSESRGNGRFWRAAGAADAVRRGTGELALRDQLPWEGRAEPGRGPGRPETSETADAARGRSGPRLTT